MDILSGIPTGWQRYDAQDIEEIILIRTYRL